MLRQRMKCLAVEVHPERCKMNLVVDCVQANSNAVRSMKNAP